MSRSSDLQLPNPFRELPWATDRPVRQPGQWSSLREPFEPLPYRELPRELRAMRPLSEPQHKTVQAVGQFRTIAAADLLGKVSENSLRTLKSEGLLRAYWVEPHTARDVRKKDQKLAKGGKTPTAAVPKIEVVTLTKQGKAYLLSNGYDEREQGTLYPGLAKAREALHDSKLYSLAQQQISMLQKAGYTHLATHTDTYLKARVHALTASRMKQGSTRIEAQFASADHFEIPVVNGKTTFPDLRIEYEDAFQMQSFIDLELVSETYRTGHMATKNAAGFASYAPSGGGFKGLAGRSPWDPDLMSKVISR